jgi:hypothetical protein
VSEPNDPLKRRVQEWLRDQGYPLELRVGQIFKDAGWNALHGRYYSDDRTGKARELDIFAAKFGPIERGKPAFGIALAVECKHSVQKPWVVLSHRSRGAERAYPGTVALGKRATMALNSYADRGGPTARIRLLQDGERRGHGAVRANLGSKTRGPNAAYAALRGVTSATKAFAAIVDAFPQQTGAFIQVILPVVVLEGTLFEMFLDDTGGEHLDRVDRVRVYSPVSGTAGSLSLVNVVTLEGLPSLVAEAEQDLAGMLPHVTKNADAIMTMAGSPPPYVVQGKPSENT